MIPLHSAPSTRRWISGALLLVLLARAWVPTGFMPTAGHGMVLKFCHAGMAMPAEPGEHGSPSKSTAHADSCPFGSAPSTGFVSSAVLLGDSALYVAHAAVEFSNLQVSLRPLRAHRSRGPPAFL